MYSTPILYKVRVRIEPWTTALAFVEARDEHAERDGSRDERDVMKEPEDAVERGYDPRLMMNCFPAGASTIAMFLQKLSLRVAAETHSRQHTASPFCDTVLIDLLS